jgi:hypothetical protein
VGSLLFSLLITELRRLPKENGKKTARDGSNRPLVNQAAQWLGIPEKSLPKLPPNPLPSTRVPAPLKSSQQKKQTQPKSDLPKSNS